MLPGLLWKKLEQRFVFFPTSVIEYTPGDVGIDFEDVFFTTDDGLRLHGWYVPGTTEFTWLWFHGNGGNIGHRVSELAILHQQLGVSLFIFDYRGYRVSELAILHQQLGVSLFIFDYRGYGSKALTETLGRPCYISGTGPIRLLGGWCTLGTPWGPPWPWSWLSSSLPWD